MTSQTTTELAWAKFSRQLGISLSGAKSRIQRGREMLRNELLDCCHVQFDRTGHIVDYEERQQCCNRCGLEGSTC